MACPVRAIPCAGPHHRGGGEEEKEGVCVCVCVGGGGVMNGAAAGAAVVVIEMVCMVEILCVAIETVRKAAWMIVCRACAMPGTGGAAHGAGRGAARL